MDHKTLSRFRIAANTTVAPSAAPQGLGLLGLDSHFMGDQSFLWASTGNLFQPGWGQDSLNLDGQQFSRPFALPTSIQYDTYPAFADDRRYSRLSAQSDNSTAFVFSTVTPNGGYCGPYIPALNGPESQRSISYSEHIVSGCTPESLGHPDSRYTQRYRNPDTQSTYSYSDTSDPCSTPTNYQSPSSTVVALDGVLADTPLRSSNAGFATARPDYATCNIMQHLSPSQSPSRKRGASIIPTKSKTEQSKCEEEKIFACAHCPYRSLRKANCKAHEKTHNLRSVKARVVCSYGNGCSRTFNRKTDMDRHVKNVRTINAVKVSCH